MYNSRYIKEGQWSQPSFIARSYLVNNQPITSERLKGNSQLITTERLKGNSQPITTEASNDNSQPITIEMI